MPEIIKILLLGAVAGLASGTLGIGGGVVIVPGLVFLAGFTYHRAAGTSLAVILPVALAGVIANLIKKPEGVDLKTGLIMGAMGVIFAYLGVWLRVEKSSERTLELLLAALFIGLAVKMIFFPSATTST